MNCSKVGGLCPPFLKSGGAAAPLPPLLLPLCIVSTRMLYWRMVLVTVDAVTIVTNNIIAKSVRARDSTILIGIQCLIVLVSIDADCRECV